MATIPVIDIGAAVRGEDHPRTIVSIRDALADYGFLYVAGHGVSEKLMTNLQTQSEQFFNQDLNEKMRFKMENAGVQWRGYFPVGKEYTSGIPDQKEGLYFGVDHPNNHWAVKAGEPMHGVNQWPSESMRNTVTEYMAAVKGVAELLLEQVGLGLGLERHYFAARFTEDPTILFRIFAYPPGAKPDDWGVREHTDMGFLTILLQDNLGGLEVKTQDGWIAAPPIPGTFVVNIGDMLELWTWGALKATLHRVRNSASVNRYSFPLFFDPSWRANLARIPKSKIKDIDWGQVQSNAEKRWDSLDIHKLDERTTYGQFVWEKISRVFPHLVPKP